MDVIASGFQQQAPLGLCWRFPRMEPGAMSDPQWQLETLAVHGGYRPAPTTRAVAVPSSQPVASAFGAAQHGADLFDLPLVAVNTSLLLLSSITYGFAMLEMRRNRIGATQLWLAVTGILGLGFLSLELYEFAHLIHQGAGPQRSAFLSSFFTLVGTHGLHVTFGIVWLVTMMIQVQMHGLIPENRRRLMCLSMFWHFLDLVWICVFTFVYLREFV
ncbi:hypothetical protein G6F50_015298 [Rhizopus delemar]|uniref:Cytochrome c oxidase subunit 3 n=1 Tax=Rhizopus delemar TaxID=936053 RepID=A0A9P7C515_9FUNG|nr:hypothetical protein G6F50_015298 [Rhizopus delemar]